MFYNLNYLSHEETYLKRKLVAFINGLGFGDHVSSSKEAPKKEKKMYIETHMLVESFTKEER